MDGGDLSDVSLVAHLLQSKLAAVTGAASMLREMDGLPADQRDELFGVVERAAASIHPVMQLLQRGMPAAALMELQRPAAPLPKRSSGVARPFPLPVDDRARVAALERLEVLDQPALPELERITRVAAATAGASAAFVNLIDTDRQWQAAASGAERSEVPRCDAMCNVTVARGAPVVVADATLDETFADSPWVTGVLGDVRLYASLPLRAGPDHQVIGTLCIVDDAPRTLDDSTVARLTDLADLASSVLESRLAGRELRRLVESYLA